MGNGMSCRNFLSDLSKPDATYSRNCAGKELVHQFRIQTKCLEDLRTCVRSNGRDAHLRHHLEHTLASRLDVVGNHFLRISSTKTVQAFAVICRNHVFN